MHQHLIQWNSNEENLFISNIISMLPLITNEDHPELGTALPNDATLIDFNLGSSDNRKYSKLTKLYSSISIDSSSGQFNIQNLLGGLENIPYPV